MKAGRRPRGVRRGQRPSAAPAAGRRPAPAARTRLPRARLRLLAALLTAALLVLVGRLFVVQVLHHETYVQQADAQHELRRLRPGRRGDVLDRHGRLLLHTLADHSLIARPAAVRDPRAVAEQLAPILERSVEEIEFHLRGHEPVVEVHAHLTPAMAEAITALDLPGLRVEAPGRRVRLVGGCELLGAVDHDGRGVEGIEHTMESWLRAEDGWVICNRDALGRDVRTLPDKLPSRSPRDGDTIVLTIDSRLQWMVEEALARGVAAHGARGGSVVVVDAWSGELLALAAAGGEPAPRRRIRRLRPVEDVFEPGSSFKVVTFAAALDRGLLNDDSLYYAEQGRCDFGGFVIRDVKPMGWLCAADVLALSSNICTAKIGEQVGARELRRYARRFGFGQRTLVELSGEQCGLLRPVSAWSGRSTATVAIGQEVSVTALQLAMAYAAIANGGELLKPWLVREARRPDGSLRWRRGPEVVRQVMRPATAATLRRYLTRAVEQGTGRRADPGLFPVAGKTGTSQRAREHGRGYAKGKYVATFAGFFPADQPELVVVVVVDEPVGQFYGGQVAAPIFADIARGTASVAAGGADRRRRERAPRPPRRGVTVPDVRLMTLAAAVRELEERGFEPTVVARGTRVVAEDPPPGSRLEPGSEVRVRCQPGQQQEVPDVRGLTLREALRELRWTGLEIKAEGKGVIVTQTPPAGAPIPAEGQCRLRLAAAR